VKTWSDFELLEEVGHGAFGTVYRAFHPTLQQHVAIKLVAVPPDRPREIEKALDEARRLAKIRHEHVVTVHDARYLDGYVGICMEFVRGESLAQAVSRGGRLGADETIALGTTLCLALSAIHRAQLIHSDIKAQNVMREDGGRVVLMDFGAGRRLMDPERTTGQYIVGTPAYMAPEVFTLQEPTAASDLYSLGVLLFYVLTGGYPVEGASLAQYALAHSRRARRYLGDLRDDLPVRLLTVVDRALQPDPLNRYRSAGEMLTAFTERAGTSPREALEVPFPVAPAERTPEPRRIDPWRPPAESEPSALMWVRKRIPTFGAVMAWLVLLVWMLGYVATKAYAIMFGLPGEFERESPLRWLEVGVRTLPLPVYLMMFGVVTFVVASFVWRMLTRLSTTLDTWSSKTSRGLVLVAGRLGLNDPGTLARALVTAQIVSVVAVYLAFDDLMVALTTVLREGPLDVYSSLGRANEEEWLLYRSVTSLLALASGSAWAILLRRPRIADAGMATVAGGLALSVVFVVMFAMPWRIVRESTFQLAQYDAQRCFVIAERSPRLFLFCPDLPVSRRVVVNESDPKLERLTQYQNIFDGIAPKVESGRRK
jgi:serine/threonine-protein kinase